MLGRQATPSSAPVKQNSRLKFAWKREILHRALRDDLEENLLDVMGSPEFEPFTVSHPPAPGSPTSDYATSIHFGTDVFVPAFQSAILEIMPDATAHELTVGAHPP